MLACSWRALRHDLIRRGRDIQKYPMKYSVNARGIVMGENFIVLKTFIATDNFAVSRSHSFYDIFVPLLPPLLVSLILIRKTKYMFQ